MMISYSDGKFDISYVLNELELFVSQLTLNNLSNNEAYRV
jgi:hypothetical protein